MSKNERYHAVGYEVYDGATRRYLNADEVVKRMNGLANRVEEMLGFFATIGTIAQTVTRKEREGDPREFVVKAKDAKPKEPPTPKDLVDAIAFVARMGKTRADKEEQDKRIEKAFGSSVDFQIEETAGRGRPSESEIHKQREAERASVVDDLPFGGRASEYGDPVAIVDKKDASPSYQDLFVIPHKSAVSALAALKRSYACRHNLHARKVVAAIAEAARNAKAQGKNIRFYTEESSNVVFIAPYVIYNTKNGNVGLADRNEVVVTLIKGKV